MKKPSVRFKSLDSSDRPALFALFRQCFGHDIDEEWWDWKYNPPEGSGKNLIALADGQVVGHYGAYPLRCMSRGSIFTIQQIGDVMIAPGFRGVGVGKRSLISLLTRAFYEECCDGVAFNYGCPSERHVRLGTRILDYELLDPVMLWELEFDRIKSSLFLCIIEKRLRNKTGVMRNCIPEEVEGLFDDVCASFPVAIKKDFSYLNWRYKGRSKGDYDFFGLSSAGKLRLWAAIKLQGTTIEFGELAFRKKDWMFFFLFIKILKEYFPDAEKIVLWANPHLWWPGMIYRAAGFRYCAHPWNIYFTVTRFDKEEFPSNFIREGMHYSMGDFDLF